MAVDRQVKSTPGADPGGALEATFRADVGLGHGGTSDSIETIMGPARG
jgi:hypothetical protein